MRVIYRASLFALICLIAACAVHNKNRAIKAKMREETDASLAMAHGWLVSKHATDETAALFYNMKLIAKKQVMFGHMEDNRNGYDGWKNTPGRSDVKEVTGAYPVVYGFDFGGIASFRPDSIVDKEAKITHDKVIEAYKRNGLITFSWHYSNPVSKGSFYWKQSPVNAVSEILPGGNYNAVFKTSLEKIARFAATIKHKGKLIPVIFRPFHEFDGDWFWWGKAHCSTDDYKALYRYTVTYLRDSLHVRNFLYAWSPDCGFNSKEKYTERYPGNEYVDIVGMDDYYDLRVGQSPSVAAGKLKIVSDFAIEQNKVAALTETGLENLPQADWYTNMLLEALKESSAQIAYVLVWSNRPSSFWTPYKGHPAEADFIAFKNDPYLLFGDKIWDLYRISPDEIH